MDDKTAPQPTNSVASTRKKINRDPHFPIPLVQSGALIAKPIGSIQCQCVMRPTPRLSAQPWQHPAAVTRGNGNDEGFASTSTQPILQPRRHIKDALLLLLTSWRCAEIEHHHHPKPNPAQPTHKHKSIQPSRVKKQEAPSSEGIHFMCEGESRTSPLPSEHRCTWRAENPSWRGLTEKNTSHKKSQTLYIHSM